MDTQLMITLIALLSIVIIFLLVLMVFALFSVIHMENHFKNLVKIENERLKLIKDREDGTSNPVSS